MTTPLSELEALRWLKDSAAQEPELPAATRTQLWTRLAHDISILPLVCTGAATTLNESATAPTGAATTVGESGPTNSGAGTAVGESGAANSGAATTLRESAAMPTGSATAASLSRALGVSARTVIARLAIWSAPALVVGAVGGVTWQRAAAPVPVHTVHVDRVASPAQSASAATATRDELGVEASPVQSDSVVDAMPNDFDLPLVTESEPPLPEPRKVSATDDRSASPSSAEPRAGNAPSSAEPRAGNALGRERAVLDRARVALAAGESERALEETKRHAREFPNGILTEEREAIAINGLVRLGRYTQANQRAARFRARYPQSLMMQSVDAAMATARRD